MWDSEYIRRFHQWDTNAFSHLYEKYIDDIYRYVLRKLWDNSLSEDICSQVWIKALQGLSTYSEKQGASFKSWLYRIAHNTLIDHYRLRKENSSLEEVAQPALDARLSEYVDNKQMLAKVLSYLSGLSEVEQEIVFLRVWDDLSYREISQITGKKVDNCKQICSRSLKKIQANITTLILLFFIL